MLSGTVSAGLGFKAATVPFWTLGFALRLLRFWLYVVEMVRLRESSDSIFLRIACVGLSGSKLTVFEGVRRLGIKVAEEEGVRGKDILGVSATTRKLEDNLEHCTVCGLKTANTCSPRSVDDTSRV